MAFSPTTLPRRRSGRADRSAGGVRRTRGWCVVSARREDILNTFWEDEDVDELDNAAVLLYLWSFTNPLCGMSGIYRCRRRALADRRLTTRQLERALKQLADARFLYYADGWVWVRSRVKNLSAVNGNIARSIVNDIARLPAGHPFIEGFWNEYSADPRLRKAMSDGKVAKPHG